MTVRGQVKRTRLPPKLAWVAFALLCLMFDEVTKNKYLHFLREKDVKPNFLSVAQLDPSLGGFDSKSRLPMIDQIGESHIRQGTQVTYKGEQYWQRGGNIQGPGKTGAKHCPSGSEKSTLLYIIIIVA